MGPKKEQSKREDFHFIGELGQGAFAKVFHVRHKASGREYAMKVFNKQKIGAVSWSITLDWKSLGSVSRKRNA